jgi:hypothetical protein
MREVGDGGERLPAETRGDGGGVSTARWWRGSGMDTAVRLHRPEEGSSSFGLGRGGGCWHRDEETATVAAGLGSAARG